MDEVSRLAELKRYQVLDTENEPVFDDVVRLAGSAFGAAISAISLIDDDRQWFKARVGIDASETPRADAFCAYAILAKDILIVSDASTDARFSSNPLVSGAPFIRFYAGVPLTSPGGYNLGTLCIIDPKPRQHFRTAERKQLANLADIVMVQLNKRVAEYERRTQERRHAGLKGVISSYGVKPTAIDIINISERGAMIKCPEKSLPKGEEIILNIGKTIIVATVAWAKDEMDGLAFHRTLSPDELQGLNRQLKAHS